MDTKENGETVVSELTQAVPAGGPSMALALSGALVDANAKLALARVDERIAFYSEVRNRSVKLTLPHDWRDFDGHPYLESTGAERLKPLWGIYIKGLRMTPELDEIRRRLRSGEHVSVQFMGLVGSRVTGEESEFVGGASSDKPFYENRKGGIEELDPENLVKHAYSNFEVNGITRLLGLRGLEWEDLEKYGFKRQAGHTYRKGGETGGDAKRVEVLREVRESLAKLHGQHAQDALWEMTKFADKDGKERGVRSWEELAKTSDKWLERIVDKVRAEVKTWEAKQPPSASSSPTTSTPTEGPELPLGSGSPGTSKG